MGWKILASDEGKFGIEEAISLSQKNAEPIEVVVAGIRAVEDHPDALTVGYNGAPNILGVMQCDASLIEGTNRLASSVAAIEGIKNPILAARKLLGVMPHIMLAGDGAKRFAIEQGLEESSLLSPGAREKYINWIKENIPEGERDSLTKHKLAKYISFKTRSNLSRGTVTFIARSPDGRFAAGASTTGWAYKYPGRCGDSPIIGAGLYADDRFGAATCTHTGEMTMRCLTAHGVVKALEFGMTLEQALEKAIEDLKSLKTGYLGPVIINGMDKQGKMLSVSTGGHAPSVHVEWNGSGTWTELPPRAI